MDNGRIMKELKELQEGVKNVSVLGPIYRRQALESLAEELTIAIEESLSCFSKHDETYKYI